MQQRALRLVISSDVGEPDPNFGQRWRNQGFLWTALNKR
jgi:hypothetical protein